MHRFPQQPLEQALQVKLKFSNTGESKNQNSYGKNFQTKKKGII